MHVNKLPLILFSLAAAAILSSCSKMGYGILLWSVDDPPVLSGTVLPVYIKSNINQVWVVGVPDTLKTGKDGPDKIEIPLPRFEFSGSRRKAVQRAEEFTQYAHSYAENLQDGLPIRDSADNNSRRVYRMRAGEIIKILGKANGIPPISTTGDPLPGDWYRVLTQDGVSGYCFSFRLKIFEHEAGSLQTSAPVVELESEDDPDLNMVLKKVWSPELYLSMINSKRIDTEALARNYRFDPGKDTNTARISMPDIEREFSYQGIYQEGERAWRFEGAELRMNLRNNATLSVQYTDNSGVRRTLVFVSLASAVGDIIDQENARRDEQYRAIYNQGPVFTSNNYGTITLTQTGAFKWTGYDLLVPQLLTEDTGGEGRVLMNLFLAPSFEQSSTGALSMRFTDTRPNINLRFMYSLDNQGIRLEVVQDYAIENNTVTRRSQSPMVLYFFKDTLF